MGDPVTWFELNGPEPKKATDFYAELFGWHTEPISEANYTLIDTFSGSGINGGIGQARQGQPAHGVIYVEAPDIQALLERAESMGAKTVVPRSTSMDITFAQFTDPFGNLIGLVEGDGSTRVSAGDNPPVNWFEISSMEPKASWDFYRELFGWEIEESSGEGYLHGEVNAGRGIPGGIGSSQRGQPTSQVYAEVDDLQKYVERAESLGAETVVGPMSVGDNTSIAVFVDPQGTMFGLYVQQH